MIDASRATGGRAALDRSFEDPPTNDAQMLDPAKLVLARRRRATCRPPRSAPVNGGPVTTRSSALSGCTSRSRPAFPSRTRFAAARAGPAIGRSRSARTVRRASGWRSRVAPRDTTTMRSRWLERAGRDAGRLGVDRGRVATRGADAGIPARGGGAERGARAGPDARRRAERARPALDEKSPADLARLLRRRPRGRADLHRPHRGQRRRRRSSPRHRAALQELASSIARGCRARAARAATGADATPIRR